MSGIMNEFDPPLPVQVQYCYSLKTTTSEAHRREMCKLTTKTALLDLITEIEACPSLLLKAFPQASLAAYKNGAHSSDMDDTNENDSESDNDENDSETKKYSWSLKQLLAPIWNAFKAMTQSTSMIQTDANNNSDLMEQVDQQSIDWFKSEVMRVYHYAFEGKETKKRKKITQSKILSFLQC